MKTTERRIARIYEKLPYSERAALVLHHACRQDEQEMDRIRATVPRHLYRRVDAEYEHWEFGFVRMSMLWALRWWQARARLMALAGCQLVLQGANAWQELVGNEDDLHDAQVSMASLRAALDQVCKECGLQVQTVLDLTGTPDVTPDVLPDDEQKAQFVGELRSCLPGYGFDD